MFTFNTQIRLEIQDIFDLGKPVTLRQLCAGLESQMSAPPTEVLPYVITAISAMMAENKICQFTADFQDPLAYQWILSTDPRPKMAPVQTPHLREMIEHLTTWREPLRQALELAELDPASVNDFILDLETALDVREKDHAADDS